jgi:hypothetical protein
LRIYEINARAHCNSFSQISQAELKLLRRAGFDAIWLMGVWRTSRAAKLLSKVVSEDFEGSPYAVPCYEYNPRMGGGQALSPLSSEHTGPACACLWISSRTTRPWTPHG